MIRTQFYLPAGTLQSRIQKQAVRDCASGISVGKIGRLPEVGVYGVEKEKEIHR